ncbi:hypothetical protein [Shewanella sp. GD03713]|uniref:hypothetical protein n=1 Tax=Shewanella TaxID=22 RepID=UPI002446890B|nr:hypothetical protein [Shewanella sp. GD03713]MDH1472651.1 hypothetical protein [Shewanella sp. GD03713]
MKIKSLLFGVIGLSVASHFGFSAEKLFPPAIVDLDKKWFNGAVMEGMNIAGKAGRDNAEKWFELYFSEYKNTDTQDSNKW